VSLQISFGQNKKITVVDKSTKSPIESVILTYSELNEGTFTNAEGTALLILKKSELKISMIGYEDISLPFEKLSKADTIFLVPTTALLEEVTVSSFNLTEEIKYVLDNYSKLYVDVPFEKECNFKETVTVDNNLKRLILTNVNWWDKTYEIKFTGAKFRLSSIKYNKNLPPDIFTDVPEFNIASNNGFINTQSIINIIYLNLFLKSFLTFTDVMKSYVEKTTPEQIDVHFETEWKKVGVSSEQHIGTITFDKKSKAIINISFETNQRDNITKAVIQQTKKEAITETKKNFLLMSFAKSLDNKLSLKSFETQIYVDMKYGDKIHNVVFENKIFVFKESKVKKVGNNGLIDLNKPIFKSLPSKIISSSNSILLTEQENNFILGVK
jgi:hypothetical protein